MDEELYECYMCGNLTDNLQGVCDDCKFEGNDDPPIYI